MDRDNSEEQKAAKREADAERQRRRRARLREVSAESAPVNDEEVTPDNENYSCPHCGAVISDDDLPQPKVVHLPHPLAHLGISDMPIPPYADSWHVWFLFRRKRIVWSIAALLIGAFLAMAFGTQWAALHLNPQELQQPIAIISGINIYEPLAIFGWFDRVVSVTPSVVRGVVLTLGSWVLCALVMTLVWIVNEWNHERKFPVIRR